MGASNGQVFRVVLPTSQDMVFTPSILFSDSQTVAVARELYE